MRFPSTVLLFAIAPSLVAQDKPGGKEAQQIARIQSLLNQVVTIERGPTGEITLEQFLARIEAALPTGKKLSLRIDREALGKDFPRVKAVTFRAAKWMNVGVVTLLQKASNGVAAEGIELDYAIRPTEVVLTRAKLAAVTQSYAIRDIMEQMPQLLPRIRAEDDLTFSNKELRDVPADDIPGHLIRLLCNEAGLRSWETVEVINATRLKIHATPFRHSEVANLLSTLRSLTDLAIYVNARLYEVDRAFYAKEVAPLFAKGKDSTERSPALPIEGKLLKAITGKKLILESDEVKLLPDKRQGFLAKQTVFRFDAGPTGHDFPKRKVRTGLVGVTFDVRPLISSHQRMLRLHITQSAVQLIGLDKVKKRDPSTGKETVVESPKMRNSVLNGTVQIDDGNPFLMRVDYQPPGKENADKVWLLVARPVIWSEEEAATLRKLGEKITPTSIWNRGPEPLSPPVPAKVPTPLPLNDETKAILQAIITDALTSKDLKNTRAFYGTESDRSIALIDGEQLGWPKDFKPATHGYKVVRPDPFDHPRRLLGIRLDAFTDLKSNPSSRVIGICLFNAGGVIGGCYGGYLAEKKGKSWVVECQGWVDP